MPPGGSGASGFDSGHGTPEKERFQALRTLSRYSLKFFASPAAVITPEEEAEQREALLTSAFMVLKCPVTTKSMTVGRP